MGSTITGDTSRIERVSCYTFLLLRFTLHMLVSGCVPCSCLFSDLTWALQDYLTDWSVLRVHAKYPLLRDEVLCADYLPVSEYLK